MNDEIRVPEDMIQERLPGGGAIVSTRDMLILLGATDEQLARMDRKAEILKREPWRNKTYFERVGDTDVFLSKGDINWTGTEFEKESE